MKSNQTFSIDFVARKCKTDSKRADIFVHITVNGDIEEISIKEQVRDCDWNSGKETVEGTTD